MQAVFLDRTEIFRKLHEIGYGGFFNFESKGKPLHDNTLEKISSVPAMIAKGY